MLLDKLNQYFHNDDEQLQQLKVRNKLLIYLDSTKYKFLCT